MQFLNNKLYYTMKISRKNQHINTYNAILELLNTLPDNGKLPGIRDLCLALGVKRDILSGELARLRSEGLIYTLPRRGNFKRKVRRSRQTVWLLGDGPRLPQTGNDFVSVLLQTIDNEAANCGWKLKFAQLDWAHLRQLPDFFRQNKIKNLFIWSSRFDLAAHIIRSCCSNVVEVLPRRSISGGFAVIDSPKLSRIQLEYLFKLGHRRIGYIHNVVEPYDHSPAQFQRLFEYYRLMAEAGLKVAPEWVFSGYCTDEVFANRLRAMMNSNGGVTAVIAAGSFLKKLYQTARDQLFAPGEDLSIIGCDELPRESEINFTSVTNSPVEIGKLAWQLMQEAQAGAPPRIVESPLQIHIGNTVKHQ